MRHNPTESPGRNLTSAPVCCMRFTVNDTSTNFSPFTMY